MKLLRAELKYEGKTYIITQECPLYDFYDDEADMKQSLEYMWNEGNYGCDCNRFLFISYAYDDYPGEEDEDGWFPCGETIRLVSLTLTDSP